MCLQKGSKSSLLLQCEGLSGQQDKTYLLLLLHRKLDAQAARASESCQRDRHHSQGVLCYPNKYQLVACKGSGKNADLRSLHQYVRTPQYLRPGSVDRVRLGIVQEGLLRILKQAEERD